MSEIKRASNSRAFLRPWVVALSITDCHQHEVKNAQKKQHQTVLGFAWWIFFSRPKTPPFFCWGVPVPEDLTCLKITDFTPFSAQGTSCHRSGREAAHRELCYVGLPPEVDLGPDMSLGKPSPNQATSKCFRRTNFGSWPWTKARPAAKKDLKWGLRMLHQDMCKHVHLIYSSSYTIPKVDGGFLLPKGGLVTSTGPW